MNTHYGNYQITQQYIKLGIAIKKSIALYLHNSLKKVFEMSKNKNINNNDMECLNIGTVRKTSKNVILSCIYRPPRGNVHIFLDEMKGHIIKKNFKKMFYF